MRDFRVRLACVRHAASVDSEPGSNSQVKVFVLRAPCGNPLGICSTREACRLFCLLRLVSACYRRRLRFDSNRPADTLTGWLLPLSLCRHREDQGLRAGSAERRAVCTLYLVFKEPRGWERLRFPVPPSRYVLATSVRGTFQDYVGSKHPVNKNFQGFLPAGPRKSTRRRTFAEQEPQAVTSEQAFRAGTSSTGRDDVSD